MTERRGRPSRRQPQEDVLSPAPRPRPGRKGLRALAPLAVALMVAAAWLVPFGGQQADAPLRGADGAALYAAHCASCHGAGLEGQPDWQSVGADGLRPAPPHDVTGHTWHHGDRLLFDYTKLGGAEVLARMGVTDVPSGMPGFADLLSDDEILAVLSFIKSTWPEEIRRVQSERTQAEAAAR